MRAEAFRSACYYAVREDFNAQNEPDFLEKNPRLDALIRRAIMYVKSPRKNKHACVQIEMIALVNCERRRKKPKPTR
jgi:hypothetical protein